MNAVVSTEAAPAVFSPDDADRRSRFATTIWVAVVAVVSGLGLGIAYRGGLVVTWGDPIAYIAVARSLAAGHGVSVPYGSLYTHWHLTAGGPVSHWPPGYPLLLSVWSGSILLWARILAVASFSASVFLFGFLAQRLGVPRFGAIALAIIFAGTSFALFGTVASEPLFFFLVLLGLHGLVSFFRRLAVPSILLASIAFGLSTVTRYLGEAFVIGGVLTILFLWREPIARRLKFAALLAIVGNIPLLIWFRSIHNSPESPSLHIASFYDLKTTLFTIASFIVPGVHSADLRVLIVAVIVIGVLALMINGNLGSLSPASPRTHRLAVLDPDDHLPRLLVRRPIVHRPVDPTECQDALPRVHAAAAVVRTELASVRIVVGSTALRLWASDRHGDRLPACRERRLDRLRHGTARRAGELRGGHTVERRAQGSSGFHPEGL